MMEGSSHPASNIRQKQHLLVPATTKVRQFAGFEALSKLSFFFNSSILSKISSNNHERTTHFSGLDVFWKTLYLHRFTGGVVFCRVLGVGHVKSFGRLGQVKETGRNDFAKPIIRKHPKPPPRTSCLEINHFKVYPGDFPDQPDSRSFWEDSS